MNRPHVTRDQYESLVVEVDQDVTDTGDWYGVDDEPNDTFHVLPVYPGERKHAASVRCWCGPRQSDDEPRLWVHDRIAEA